MPLIRLFLDIGLLRKGPQDGPASILLLAFTVSANLAVGTGLAFLEADGAEALAQSLVGVLLLAGFLWVTLNFTGKAPRLLKTATAAFGCDTLISLVAIPILLWARLTPGAPGMAGMLLLVLMLWQMTVIGHILRHALSVSFLAGLGLALGYTVVSYRIMTTLFPPVA